MRAPDARSVLVAGLLGALGFGLYGYFTGAATGNTDAAWQKAQENALTGFFVGSVVQIGVRLAGVS